MTFNARLGTTKLRDLGRWFSSGRIRAMTIALNPTYYIDAALETRPRQLQSITSISPIWPTTALAATVTNTTLGLGYNIAGSLVVSSVSMTIGPTQSHTMIFCYAPNTNHSQWGDCGFIGASTNGFQAGVIVFSQNNVGIGVFVSRAGVAAQVAFYTKRPSLLYRGSPYVIVQRCTSGRMEGWVNEDKFADEAYNSTIAGSLQRTNPRLELPSNFNGTLYYLATFGYAMSDTQIETVSRYLRLLYGCG